MRTIDKQLVWKLTSGRNGYAHAARKFYFAPGAVDREFCFDLSERVAPHDYVTDTASAACVGIDDEDLTVSVVDAFERRVILRIQGNVIDEVIYRAAVTATMASGDTVVCYGFFEGQ